MVMLGRMPGRVGRLALGQTAAGLRAGCAASSSRRALSRASAADSGTTRSGRRYEYVPEMGGKGAGEADMSVASILAELSDEPQLDTGTVVHVKGSVARVQGLREAKMGGVVSIAGSGGMRGLVVGLKKRVAVVALLGEENAASDTLMIGQDAQLVAERLSVPASACLPGAFSPLGVPLPEYGFGADHGAEGAALPMLSASLPSLSERSRTSSQLFSGLKVVDTFFPLGLGQKLGFVGDRGTGKRRAVLDLIRNQHRISQASDCSTPQKCVYVSVGQTHGAVSKLAQRLQQAADAEASTGGLASSTTLVVAKPTDSWGVHYLAPFAGLAIANAHRAKGEDVLLVIDDSAKWTRVAVEVASQFVGVPMSGVAPLHASVLEHAGALRSGGSLTTISIVDTENEELNEPTVDAVVSLVDVLLPFDPQVKNAGTAPALDVEAAISTVGSAPYQAPPLRKLASCLRQTLRDTADDALRAEILVDRKFPFCLAIYFSRRSYAHTGAHSHSYRNIYLLDTLRGAFVRALMLWYPTVEMGLDIDEEADDDLRVSLSQRAVIRAVLNQGALRAPATALSNDITSTVAKMAAKARAAANKGRSVRGARAMTGSGGVGPETQLCSTPAELLLGMW